MIHSQLQHQVLTNFNMKEIFMGGKKMKTKIRHLVVVLVTVLTFSFLIMPVMNSAYAEKKVTAARYTKKLKLKKVKAVKKGLTTITCPKAKSRNDEFWVKFKVPKTKKYTFTFSQLNSGDDPGKKTQSYAWFYLYQKKGKKILTKGYKGTCDSVWTDGIYPYIDDEDEETILYPKGSVKIKLKKGQTIYIACSPSSGNKITYQLNIK